MKTIAQEISEYLTTGMHHSTVEAQTVINELIANRVKNTFVIALETVEATD